MPIIGHEKILKYLEKSIEKDKISHAYLFSGPKHLGKFSTALNFAKKITGGEEKKVNPDIIIISPETEPASTRGDCSSTRGGEKDIKIEQIRDLSHQLSLSAYFGKYKVAIVDGADRLTVSAQNSLLKTLEEPQKNCVLILICHNEGKILPTIKSRCLIKKFSLVSDEEIANLVTDEKNKKEIIFWSLSRPGLAIDLQEKKEELEKRKEASDELKNVLQGNLSEKFDLCEKLGKNQTEAREKIEFWAIIFRENILGKNNFLKISQEKSLEIVEEIQKSLELIQETNSNLRSILENLVLKF